jgi:hypothetical protein
VVTSSVCVCITSEENHMAAVPSIPQNPSAEFTPLLETLTRKPARNCGVLSAHAIIVRQITAYDL